MPQAEDYDYTPPLLIAREIMTFFSPQSPDARSRATSEERVVSLD